MSLMGRYGDRQNMLEGGLEGLNWLADLMIQGGQGELAQPARGPGPFAGFLRLLRVEAGGDGPVTVTREEDVLLLRGGVQARHILADTARTMPELRHVHFDPTTWEHMGPDSEELILAHR